MKLIRHNINQIIALCHKHRVTAMYVFGSVLTDRFDDNSDIDLLVNFDTANINDCFDNYFELKYALESLFGRDVDLVEEKTIHNQYLKNNIDKKKLLIYGRVD